jgi:hypothetical protein
MKVLKGSLLLHGKLYNFKVTIHAPRDATQEILDFLTKKLQQRGWMP